MDQLSKATYINGNQTSNLNPDNLDKVAHDIRGAINIINGYTQMMLDEATGPITAEQRRALDDIMESVTQLSKLTETLVRECRQKSSEKSNTI